MNSFFRNGMHISISNEQYEILYADIECALLKNANSGERIHRSISELFELWSDRHLHVLDSQGRRADPDGLSPDDEAIIKFRLPYALRFSKGLRKVNPKTVIQDIAATHNHDPADIPSIATCYRYATDYQKSGAIGLRNKHRRSTQK